GAGAARQGVVAHAAVQGQLDHVGLQSRGVEGVVAAEPVDHELVVGYLGARHTDEGRQPHHGEAGAGPQDLDGVVPAGAVDDDGVRRAVAGPGAGGAGQVEVHLGDAGAGEVADGDGIDAAPGGEIDLLDAIDVHDDGADVAGEAKPRPV